MSESLKKCVENAPSAPYVQVWESAPMTASPATTRPFSGRSHFVLAVHMVLVAFGMSGDAIPRDLDQILALAEHQRAGAGGGGVHPVAAR